MGRVEGDAVVRTAGLTKAYDGSVVLSDMDFDVRAGEVHAVIGENGSGKSTLCKILSGAVAPTAGDVFVDERKVQFASPRDALRRGVGIVYQETSLVPFLTVAQNVAFGGPRRWFKLRGMNATARQELGRLRFHVNPTALVQDLRPAQRKMVEITRALQLGARVLIFDEPTTSLTLEETEHLFSVIDTLRQRGVAMVFVSHMIDECLRISDRVTVLRDGKLVSSGPTQGATRQGLIRDMVGRAVEFMPRRAHGERHHAVAPTLQVENLVVGNVVRNMSFSAYPGEVLGIFGLVGAGRTETARVIAGALKRNRIRGGQVTLYGRPVRYRVPRGALRDGIAYVTDDRKIDGFFETMGVTENVFLGATARQRVGGVATQRLMRKTVAPFVEKLSVRSTGAKARLVELSGGNQQKTVIGKALSQAPDVVIFDDPTVGVDVATIEEIHKLIRASSDEGKTVIVISSYVPELLAVADRILVAQLGRIVGEFDPATTDEKELMYAAVHHL